MLRRDFERIVREELEALPPFFREKLENIEVLVEDRPTVEELAELGLGPDDLLYGAYWGTPQTERTHNFTSLPDVIVLYQEDIECMCRTRREVREEIRKTIIHEIGHHFGMDEERLKELGVD